MRKRQETRLIQSAQDEYGSNQRTTKGIMRAFVTFLRRKYEPIAVDDECVTYMDEAERRTLPTAWGVQFEQPISPEEVHIAMRKWDKNKAPGSDRIWLEFYKAN